MSEVQQILSQLPMGQLAQMVGADESQVAQAAQAIVPTLLGGMAANAQDPAGEQSLAQALTQHQSGYADPSAVDQNDGAKAVSHIFGQNEQQVVSQLGGIGGGNDIVKRLLPILAPIVMSYLSQRVLGGSGGNVFGQGSNGNVLGQGTQTPQSTQAQGQTVDQNGQVLGQGAATGQAGGLGGILSQVLGGALGSGSVAGGQGGLGSILGGLLGGGTRA